jgi:hypothetical protein
MKLIVGFILAVVGLALAHPANLNRKIRSGDKEIEVSKSGQILTTIYKDTSVQQRRNLKTSPQSQIKERHPASKDWSVSSEYERLYDEDGSMSPWHWTKLNGEGKYNPRPLEVSSHYSTMYKDGKSDTSELRISSEITRVIIGGTNIPKDLTVTVEFVTVWEDAKTNQVQEPSDIKNQLEENGNSQLQDLEESSDFSEEETESQIKPLEETLPTETVKPTPLTEDEGDCGEEVSEVAEEVSEVAEQVPEIVEEVEEEAPCEEINTANSGSTTEDCEKSQDGEDCKSYPTRDVEESSEPSSNAGSNLDEIHDEKKPAKEEIKPNNDKRPKLMGCLSEKQNKFEEECLALATNWFRVYEKKNFNDCVARSSHLNVELKNWDVKEHCRSFQMKQMRVLYSDCIIASNGALNHETGQIDSRALRVANIGESKLSDWQKTAAYATFDACLASDFSLPYSLYHFNEETFPDKFHDYTALSDNVFSIGPLTPTMSMVTVDCMRTALLQNGCADTATEAAITKAMEVLIAIRKL